MLLKFERPSLIVLKPADMPQSWFERMFEEAYKKFCHTFGAPGGKYYIKCDGVDDGVFFNEAIDFLPKNPGGKVYCEGDTFAIQTTITGVSYLTLEGAGRSTELEAQNDDIATIDMSGCTQAAIKNLKVTNAGGNDGTHYGIYTDGASYLKLVDLFLSGYNNNIHIIDQNTTEIDRVSSLSAVFAAGTTGCGAYISHATAGTGLRVRDSDFAANDKTGLRIENHEAPHLANVAALLNSEYGIYLKGRAAKNASFLLTGIEVDSNDAGGLLIEDYINGTASVIWASNDIFGLKLVDVLRSSFGEVTAYGCDGIGIWLTGSSIMNSFDGAIATDCTGDGFQIDNGCYGNTFASPAAWNNAGWGFDFDDVTANEPNQLSAYYARGNTAGQVSVQVKDILLGEQEAWQDVATGVGFQNAWVNFGGAYATAAYFRDGFGIVHLRGMIKDGVMTAAAFTLPVGYRPLADEIFVSLSNDLIARVDFTAAGNVIPMIGTNDWIILNGITFRVA